MMAVIVFLPMATVVVVPPPHDDDNDVACCYDDDDDDDDDDDNDNNNDACATAMTTKHHPTQHAMPQWQSLSSCPCRMHGLCVIVITGACIAVAVVVMERITPNDNQTYRHYLVIVATKAAAIEAIIFV